MSRNTFNSVTYGRYAQDQDVRNQMFMKSLGTAAGYDDIDEDEVNRVLEKSVPKLNFPPVPSGPPQYQTRVVSPPQYQARAVSPPRAASPPKAASPPIDIYANCKLTKEEKESMWAQWTDYMLYEKPDNEPFTDEEKKLVEDLKKCGVLGVPKRRMRLRKSAAKRKTKKTRSQYVKKVKKVKRKTTKRKTNKK